MLGLTPARERIMGEGDSRLQQQQHRAGPSNNTPQRKKAVTAHRSVIRQRAWTEKIATAYAGGKKQQLRRAHESGSAKQTQPRGVHKRHRGMTCRPAATRRAARRPSPFSPTLPNTTCRPSSQAAFAVVTKNWQPFVFGPLFAMDRSPGPVGHGRGRAGGGI